MLRIALVTARAALGLDDDLAPLAAALEEIGAKPAIESWDDPGVRWEGFDAAILRSTWDYPQRLEEFVSWARDVAAVTSLHNPVDLVEWNTDKAYLLRLAAAGVPTVPTILLEPGGPITLPDTDEIVVKPSISAGSRDTARFTRDAPAALTLIEHIWSSGRTAMVQPYLRMVDSHGERALVCFDGEPSHAFTKAAILRPGAVPTTDLFADEEITPATATVTEVAVARDAMRVIADRMGEPPLYARIDLVPSSDGTPLVLEAELIEPSVYHHTDPASAARFASAIVRRQDRGRGH